MNEKFVPLLKYLDLSPTEIKIYIALLKHGMSSVYDLNKFTKINRQQIYNDTQLMIEKGVLELASKRPKKFLAINPSKLSKLIEAKKSKLDELANILPETSEFFERSKIVKDDDFEIRIYEGVLAVRKVFLTQLETAGVHPVYCLVGDLSSQYEIIPKEFWDKNNLKFKNKGGESKMIINKDDVHYRELSTDGKKHFSLETRGLNNFKIKSNFDVWGDNVLVSTYTKEPKAIYIRNKIVANTLKEIFEMLWKIAE